MGKTALIVDDSKTARVVLKRMLETNELEVVSAESAEDALEYLRDFRPDIIFMDHEMPGMDGLQAVSAIKNNPATATIPIMMYTAQRGELYVGQARALGAIGVLPKDLEPVEVSKVLESLRIIGEDAESRERPRAAEGAAESGEYPVLESFDHDLKAIIKDLFDQQRAILRRELRDSEENIAARVADEIRSPEAESVEVPSPKVGIALPAPMQLLVVLMTVIAMLFAFLFWRREAGWQDLQQEYVALQRAQEEVRANAERGNLETGQRLVELRESLLTARDVALESLEWAANQSARYGIGELPLGDYRLSVIQALTDHLVALEFRGVVRIESHVGNFCMSFSGPDGYGLAQPDLPVTQCDQVGFDPGDAYEMGLRQSVPFANFIYQAGDRTDGAIRYEIISLGNSSPLRGYPLVTPDVTAAEWNQIAASNNRVEISLLPDSM